MMTSADIRKNFLDFFRSKGHIIVPSAPIIVKDDPTLMFTNAGMNQFKDYFLGNKKTPNPRVADTQKCLRVSGKHNDLEEVGVDTYHHTMFEMLGNWSFGDYFKSEAIAWSWELLTEVYKIPKDKLYVTVFEGDKGENLPADHEAIKEWKKWITGDRILPGNKKDNFWEMGDTGPCGPCTEIHVDCRSEEERKKLSGKELVNNDHPQVIEIWNNVFIQFNRLKDGSLEPLPAKHVDTGMGLERLVRILQEKDSNYDTDIFSGIIAETEKITRKSYEGDDSKSDVAFRVIADHIRAIAFTIADGLLPSNTGAGYVIRRILRRAARYYYSYLDYKQPLLHQLLPLLAEQFKNVFPELQKQIDFVSKVVKEEEEAFLRTLDKGLKRIDDIIKTSSSRKLSGKEVFELYDTYGFPVDLTKLIATENSLEINEQDFEKEMQQQKERSRAATTVDTEDWIILNENGSSEFVGYDSLEAKTSVIKYRKVNSKGKESYQFVLNKTPFYAESGGQVGDTGELILPSLPGEGPGVRLMVTNTKKENDLIIHFTESIPADFSGSVIAKVDAVKRKRIEVHHSATHLMHAALRKVLGTHVTQKGSLVNEEHLRFDFSHFGKMTDEEIAQVEALVNEKIRENIPVIIKEMPKEEALKLGAMALFGEKYGDMVRVVIMDPQYSVELCGGTHVGSTGELGIFKITHESALAAGVRRIEALSGEMAEDFINEQMNLLRFIREKFKNPKDLQNAINKTVEEKNQLQKSIAVLEQKMVNNILEELLDKSEQKFHYRIISGILNDISVNMFNQLLINLSNKLKENYFIILGLNNKNETQFAFKYNDPNYGSTELNAEILANDVIIPKLSGKLWWVGRDNNNLRMAVLNKQNLGEVVNDIKEKVLNHIQGVQTIQDFLNSES